MHPLIPDDYAFRAADRTTASLEAAQLPRDRRAGHAGRPGPAARWQDLLYSFGTAHPGAVSLHNFPKFLQEFERPDGKMQDLAATDILRIRELGVPRYNEFRRLLHLKPAASFEELTDNPTWAAELRRVYGDVERVDLTVGHVRGAEAVRVRVQRHGVPDLHPDGVRRLKSDRFFTVDYTPRVYTPEGIAWIDATDMSAILRRHVPELGRCCARRERLRAVAGRRRLSHNWA